MSHDRDVPPKQELARVALRSRPVSEGAGLQSALELPVDPDGRDARSEPPAACGVPHDPARRVSEAAAWASHRHDVALVIRLEEALQRCPSSASLHYALGLVYGRRKEWVRAVQCLHAAADIDPRCYATWRCLALAQRHAGDCVRSRISLQHARAVAPAQHAKRDIERRIVGLLRPSLSPPPDHPARIPT